MNKIFCAALVLAVAAMTGSAGAADKCLQLGRISDWSAPDSRTVIVKTTNRTKYRLDLMGSCNGINFRETVAFKSFGGSGLSCLTPGDSVLYRNDVDSIGRCPIKAVSLYTPDMEKADKLARQARRNAQ